MNRVDHKKVISTIKTMRSERELKSFLSELDENCRISFNEFFLSNIDKKNKSIIIKKSGISREYAYQILSGAKNPSRDKIIALCLAAEFDTQQTNKSLKLCGKNPLSIRDKKDICIIFAVSNKLNIIKTNELLDNMNLTLLEI